MLLFCVNAAHFRAVRSHFLYKTEHDTMVTFLRAAEFASGTKAKIKVIANTVLSIFIMSHFPNRNY